MHSSRFGFRLQFFKSNSSSIGQKNGDFLLRVNSFACHQDQRSFAVYRNKRRLKIPLATPSWETLLTGRGVTFTPPKKEDKTAFVGFVSSPRGYQERTDQAQKYGVQNFYWNSDRDSVYTLHMDDSYLPSQSLEEYVQDKMDKFSNKFPDSILYPVKLNHSLTSHLDQKNLLHKTVIFNQGSAGFTTSGQLAHSLPYMSFFLKTPGSFWRLNWYSHLDNLLKRNLGFCKAVKDLKVILREEPKVSIDEPKVPIEESKVPLEESKEKPLDTKVDQNNVA